jgi:hypothetical protein
MIAAAAAYGRTCGRYADRERFAVTGVKKTPARVAAFRGDEEYVPITSRQKASAA